MAAATEGEAAAGGGGRGIRIAEDEDSLRHLVPQAQAEAQAAFGDGSYYLEYMVINARHIEVQIMGDGKDAVHFFERECSLQRRRQNAKPLLPSFFARQIHGLLLHHIHARQAANRLLVKNNRGTP